jgi:hypothetical protein
MSALPPWADNAEARALLAAIRIEQPECWMLTRHAWTNCREPKFKGANARALRAMWEAARDAAMNANDRDLYALLNRQHPDDLIDRMLNEPTVPYTPVEIKDLGGNTHRVAA